MEYPGNAALSDDIKERIVSTFRQTVETARKGNPKEALLGCDFILKLDPEFAPAQKLLDRLQAPPGAAPASSTRVAGEDLVGKLRSLITARRFEEAVQLARRNATDVATHATLQVLAQEAQSRLEAEPYIQSFLDSARQALADGEADDTRKHLEKARGLDPQHPGLLELEQAAKASTLAPEEGSFFSLDLEEPVTNFTLEEAAEAAAVAPPQEPDPLSSFAMLDEMDAPPKAVEPEKQAEVAPFAALSDAPSLTESASVVEDDPLAAFAAPVEEAAPLEELDDDPFAALSTAFSDVAEPVEADSPGSLEELEDDPFAVFAEETAGTDQEGGSAPALGDTSFGDARVTDLLAEGQAAFDRGDHQGAIDAWSRIFLIDLDNDEASRRIEAARQMKAESERQVEEVYHEGLAAWKSGSTDEAKQAFERVLAIEPGHARAQEHLERLASGEDPEATHPPADPSAIEVLPSTPDASLLDEILVPPDPDESLALGGPPPTEDHPPRPARTSRMSRKFVLIAIGVLLAVGAGGGYLFSNRDAFFPNTASAPSSGPEANGMATPLDRARKLHESGKTKLAIAQLKRLPENHPSYEEAQKLLADWAAALAPPAEEPPAIAHELASQRDELINEAHLLESQGEFLRVKEALAAAAEIAPLSGEEAALSIAADERLEPLHAEIDALAERDWDFALKSLWRKHTADPGNRDVIRLLVNCYYNMAVRDLQRGDQASAVQSLDEALALAPDDDEAIRHRSFAQAYSGGATDLLYRIYVKYLPYR